MMTRNGLYRAIGLVIVTLAAAADTTVHAAEKENSTPRRVSPRLIINVPSRSMDGLDSVTFGPGGQLVASGTWEEPIRVFDPVTGKELRKIDAGYCHGAWVAFSPDGRQMVCAMGYRMKPFPLLDFETGKILKTFEGHEYGSRLAVFSPDGRQILTTHADLLNYNLSEVVLWDVASGQRIRQYCQGTDQPVCRARFSPDGQRILTVHRLWRRDGDHRTSACIWNAADGKLVHTFTDPERVLEDAIFSPDGKTVLACCGEVAVLWDAISGKKIRTFAGHRAKIQSIALSPDGTRILTGSADRTAGIWETANGKRIGTIPVVVGIVNNVAFSPDGQSAAVGLPDRGAVEIWDLDDVKLGPDGPPVRAFDLRPFKGTREEALAVLREADTSIRTSTFGRIVAMTLTQNHIPDEVFACVACFPELEELVIRFSDTDDFRLQYLAGLTNLKRLTIHQTDISDEGLAVVGKFTSLEQLDLSESHLVGWGIAYLKSLDKLTSLNLERSWHLGGEALEHLGQLDRLESLNLLGDFEIHPEAFRHLAGARSLKYLNVSGTRCDDEAMKAIAKLPRLQTLVFHDNSIVGPKGVRNLGGSPVETLYGPPLKEGEIASLGGLTRLRSYYRLWPAARDSDLPNLARMKVLANLSVRLTGTPAGAAGWKSLGQLSGLEALTIAGKATSDWTVLDELPRVPRLTHLSLIGVPDEALAKMPRLEHLQMLNLTYARIDGSGLVCLQRLPRLRSLMLDPHTLKDDNLAALAQAKSLEELSLSGRPVDEWGSPTGSPRPASEPRTLSEDSLKHLARMSTLRRLDLARLPITDQGLAPLAGLGNLEQLNLDGTRITDAALKHLEGMRQMKQLSFLSTPVGYEAAVRLQRDHMPACYMDDNWCCGCMALTPLLKSRAPAKIEARGPRP